MKTYVKNTILFLFLSVMLSACGDESGTKTFSTRGNGSGINSKAVVPQLNDEQKVEKAQEALDLARKSLSQIIDNMSDERFEDLPEGNQKNWFVNTISSIRVSAEEENNNQRFEEVVNYFGFDSNGDLVAQSDFLEKFDAQAHIENMGNSVRMLYIQILSEIHFMLSEGDSLENYKTSQDWASKLMVKHVEQNNIYCGAGDDQTVIIINRLTGLAQTATGDSLEARGVDFSDSSTEEVSLFLDINSNLIDSDIERVENKIMALASMTNGSDFSELKGDLILQGELEKVFSIGEPNFDEGFVYSGTDSSGNSVVARLISDSETETDLSLSVEIDSNDGTELVEIETCNAKRVAPIELMGIKAQVEEEGVSTDESIVTEVDAVDNQEDSPEEVIEASVETDGEDTETEQAMSEFEDQSPAEVEISAEADMTMMMGDDEDTTEEMYEDEDDTNETDGDEDTE